MSNGMGNCPDSLFTPISTAEGKRMFIAMNRFRIAIGFEDHFEDLWRKRDSYRKFVDSAYQFFSKRNPISGIGSPSPPTTPPVAGLNSSSSVSAAP